VEQHVAKGNVICHIRRAKQFIHNGTNVGEKDHDTTRQYVGTIYLSSETEAAPTSATARSRAACLAARSTSAPMSVFSALFGRGVVGALRLRYK
jgi:hypothetical protein